MPAKNHTKKSEKQKYKKLLDTPLTVVILLLVFALVAVTSCALQQRKNTNDIRTIEQLLFQDLDKLPGYACGIFSEVDAQDFLEKDVKRSALNGSTPARWNGEETMTLRRVDGCYYEATDNSTKYAHIIIQTYPDTLDAQKEFEQVLPPVSVPIEKDNLVSGAQKVIYDAGVHYVLKDRQVIQIAASNGVPSESEKFSEELVRLIESRL